MSSRLLLIRPGAIGDCILSFPALEHVSADYKKVWIPSAIVPLVRFANAVRPLVATGIDLVGVGDLEIPERLQQELRSFDSIISWYGTNRPEFREALTKLGVQCKFCRALPASGTPEHAIDFFAAQVGAPPALAPRIELPASASRDTIVVHPFSGSPAKNWPLDRFRQLSAQLPLTTEWIAGPDESLPEAVRISNLAELGSWISGARLYIGNDSGITHLAAAVGVRTLALFGAASPATWMPRGENVTVLRSERLDHMAVETVAEAANRLLDSR